MNFRKRRCDHHQHRLRSRETESRLELTKGTDK